MSKRTIRRSKKKGKKTHQRQEKQEKKKAQKRISLSVAFFVNKLIKKKKPPFESSYIMYRGVSLNFRLSHHRHQHHHKYLLI
jgi:hypothetical protein